MAIILCTWEFGSNLGHLNQLKLPISIALLQGHTVYLATKELHRVRDVLGDLPIKYLQAPCKQGVRNPNEPKFLSYTHIFQHQLLGTKENLEGTILGWRTLFDLVKPDLVLYESSPIALIASRGYDFKKVIVGNGFAIPPYSKVYSDPFAVFLDTPKTFEVYEQLRKDDAEVLLKINSVLTKLGITNFIKFPEIYRQVDDTFLMTLPILDHYGDRGAKYLGTDITSTYCEPVWPSAEGTKVFIYLNNIPSLESLMYCVRLSKLNALIYIKDCPSVIKLRYQSDSVKFIDTLVDLDKVVAQVDWVITHGNHSTTVQFLRGGIPQLLIPQQQEHYYLALRLKEAGCAVMAYIDQPTYVNEFARMNKDLELKQKALEVKKALPSYEELGASKYISDSFEKLIVKKD